LPGQLVAVDLKTQILETEFQDLAVLAEAVTVHTHLTLCQEFLTLDQVVVEGRIQTDLHWVLELTVVLE
jgi:hypothetical protein